MASGNPHPVSQQAKPVRAYQIHGVTYEIHKQVDATELPADALVVVIRRRKNWQLRTGLLGNLLVRLAAGEQFHNQLRRFKDFDEFGYALVPADQSTPAQPFKSVLFVEERANIASTISHALSAADDEGLATLTLPMMSLFESLQELKSARAQNEFDFELNVALEQGQVFRSLKTVKLVDPRPSHRSYAAETSPASETQPGAPSQKSDGSTVYAQSQAVPDSQQPAPFQVRVKMGEVFDFPSDALVATVPSQGSQDKYAITDVLASRLGEAYLEKLPKELSEGMAYHFQAGSQEQAFKHFLFAVWNGAGPISAWIHGILLSARERGYTSVTIPLLSFVESKEASIDDFQAVLDQIVHGIVAFVNGGSNQLSSLYVIVPPRQDLSGGLVLRNV